MRVLVTGLSGFVGGWLAEALLEDGHEVVGVDRSGESPALATLRRATTAGRLRSRVVDLRDVESLQQALAEEQPDAVVHLAGLTFVPKSLENPREAWEVNTLGTVDLLAAIAREVASARVLVVTSGEVYGDVAASELPVCETNELRPLSPYAASKAGADLAAWQAHRTWKLDVVRARPFNHTGPGQAPIFVCSEFAKAVAAAELGVGPAALRVGNLEAERDFSDVRDIVRGYVRLLEAGVAGEAYDLGRGQAVAVRSVLDHLVARSRVPLDVGTDPAKLRPAEVARLYPSCRKIREAVGWRAERPLEATLDDLLEYWRTTLGAPG